MQVGKRNAKKDFMYKSWLNKYPDIFPLFGQLPYNNEEKIPNPINDIVDAYFISELQRK